MDAARPPGVPTPKRPLTHLLDLRERGLAVKATRGCSVDDCDRMSTIRGLCKTHYNRKQATGDVGAATIRRYRSGAPCQAADCGRSVKDGGLGYCTKHYRRVMVHGDATRVDRARGGGNRPGPLNSNWRGDEVGYDAAHDRVEALRGKAATHPCAHCSAVAKEWAYDHVDPAERRDPACRFPNSPYSLDSAHYLPLCVPCHRRFDRTHGSL